MPHDDRLANLDAYRAARRAAYHARRAAKQAMDHSSMMDEALGNAEHDLAVDCLEHGPLAADGREYAHEDHGGIPCLAVRPLDEALMVGVRNCPDGVDEVP